MPATRTFSELALTLVDRLINDVHTDLYVFDNSVEGGRLYSTGGFTVTREEAAMLRDMKKNKEL